MVMAAMLLGTVLLATRGLAAECGQWVAKAVSVQGPVEAKRAGQVQWAPSRQNDAYCPGDMVRVRESGRAELLLSNETTLRLDQKTTVTFGIQDRDRGILTELLSGALHFFSRLPRSLKVVTPSVNAAVKGTEALVKVDGGETSVTVLEGEVLLDNDAGSISVVAGQSAVALKGQPPILRLVVRPRDAVQWALYYPPVVSYCPEGFPPGREEALQPIVRKSITLYCGGDLTGALEALSGVPADLSDPSVLVYRATLLLAVGRISEARGDLARAVTTAPPDSNALALQSVIALVLNDREESLALAQRAVESNPRSASARISLSYALQARFDLTASLAAAREATEIDGTNPLAWARLAEVYQALGYLKESLMAAEKAASLHPNFSRVQSVRGFAFLTQVRTAEAETAFDRAMMLDQADPLPRLGMGLAWIRSGRLEEGRREIEIAAGLDPGNSLIRSYLGKAYYEEKRDDKAANQFTAAEELDPLDPTPWFYDAIQKQSINRPVEALQALQKAISLNDNREVYRSRLLLDSDLASRSANLGRIYANLGFQQLALVEGWRSVNTDPSNFSAHRFLADSYSTLPRHEIARVSELLQSQLLQPININPVQPRLGEPKALIPAGTGPSLPSYNEYNPLFDRDQVVFQASGIAGEQQTVGDELALSGVKGKFSFSLGQLHYETDGFRPNNGLRQDLYNVYAQGLLSPWTSVQAEFRSRDAHWGDRELRFDPEDFLPTLRQNEESRIARVGLRHSFSPGSNLIASFAYQDLKDSACLTSEQPFGTTTVDTSVKQKGFIAEVQHLYRSGPVSLISGAGYFSADQNSTTSFQTAFSPEGPPLPPQTQTDRVDKDLSHTNLYVYSQFYPLKSLTLLIGLSGDLLRGSFRNRSQPNPKVGITWTPLPSTTLRAAAFRVLTRSLINSQTLEPTQVAGFNQFFDDPEGTESWRYGVALDQRFTDSLSAGVDYSQRDLKVPFRSIVQTDPESPPAAETSEADWSERNGRAYLYWTPHRWLALSAEYFYEKFDRGGEFTQGVEYVRTQRVPLGINLYHPSGFSLQVRATYVDQEGRFVPQQSEPGASAIPGSDGFWVFDASLGYRLPKRLGFITIGASNLFDKKFRYQDMDPFNPTLQPKRTVFGKATVYL
jgi:tetratricopeptide (TPR) repeat protein